MKGETKHPIGLHLVHYRHSDWDRRSIWAISPRPKGPRNMTEIKDSSVSGTRVSFLVTFIQEYGQLNNKGNSKGEKHFTLAYNGVYNTEMATVN